MSDHPGASRPPSRGSRGGEYAKSEHIPLLLRLLRRGGCAEGADGVVAHTPISFAELTTPS